MRIHYWKEQWNANGVPINFIILMLSLYTVLKFTPLRFDVIVHWLRLGNEWNVPLWAYVIEIYANIESPLVVDCDTDMKAIMPMFCSLHNIVPLFQMCAVVGVIIPFVIKYVPNFVLLPLHMHAYTNWGCARECSRIIKFNVRLHPYARTFFPICYFLAQGTFIRPNVLYSNANCRIRITCWYALVLSAWKWMNERSWNAFKIIFYFYFEHHNLTFEWECHRLSRKSRCVSCMHKHMESHCEFAFGSIWDFSTTLLDKSMFMLCKYARQQQTSLKIRRWHPTDWKIA